MIIRNIINSKIQWWRKGDLLEKFERASWNLLLQITNLHKKMIVSCTSWKQINMIFITVCYFIRSTKHIYHVFSFCYSLFFWSTCRVNTWKSSVKITRLSVCDPRILMLLTIVRITGEIWARLLAHFQWNNDKQKREKIFYFVKPRPVIFALIRSYETVVSMMSGDAHFWIAYTRFPVPVKNILWRHREFWKTHTSWVWQGLSAG